MNDKLLQMISGIVMALCFINTRAGEELRSEPVVYEDQHILIQSTVMHIEDKIFHLGDIVSLVIRVEYDSNSIRVVNLDETLLTHSWSESTGIIVRDGPKISRSTSGGRTRIKAVYGLQIVGCPDIETPPCPGGKIHRLPDISLGMELISDEDRVISITEAKFRPWPGYIALSSALPLRNGELEPFDFYFPRRAFGSPIPIEVSSYPALLIFMAGFLTVGGMIFAPTARIWMRRRVPSQIAIFGTRWERVLDRLQDENIRDEEFWEGIRTAITWYYHDQYRLDTLQWFVEDNHAEFGSDEETNQLKKLFLEATCGGEVDGKRREDVLNILSNLFERK